MNSIARFFSSAEDLASVKTSLASEEHFASYIFPSFLRCSNLDHNPASTGRWLATVSLFALSVAMVAGPAQADCTQQGLDQTCTGDLGPVDFAPTDTNSSQTVTLTIENATNESFTSSTPDSAIWTLGASASDNGQGAAAVQLDIDLTSFELYANDAPGVEVFTTGHAGKTFSGQDPNEGDGDRTGEAGGVGGTGGPATATISGLTVSSSDANLVFNSSSGAGGTGQNGNSSDNGDGTGGEGGAGGLGGLVYVTLNSSDFESGLGLAINSSGGLGGAGGRGETSKGTATAGSGGAGGKGGAVTATISELTADSVHSGVQSESLGGAGGEGGEGNASGSGKSYGGHGGNGGDGGKNDLTVNNSEFTSGHGVAAQSFGGEGGAGGEGYSHNQDATGGDGGTGGKGGTVTASISGMTTTGGPDELFDINSISALSAGGDGGIGGQANSINDGNAYGGDGGDGGDGGQTNLSVTNSHLTYGNGLFAGSIAGDGGNAGEGNTNDHNSHGGDGGDGGNGGSVFLKVSDFSIGDVSDPWSTGIVATSQGGAGGLGAEATNGVFADSFGGVGGVGGDGGAINVSNTLDDGTTGNLEINVTSTAGLLAESVAGNGAMGGQGNSGGSGGAGGQGGTGGGVIVDISQADSGELSSITTVGDNSAGLVARSYGGAGGDGGDGHGLGTDGGAGAGSGPSGGVNVVYTGQISTDGTLSDGIFAQSVGGFAGDSGDVSGIVAYGESPQSAGAGGGVTVNYDGTGGNGISTTGDDSDGIFAQSQGGGGGKASSTSGLVSLSGDEEGSSGGDGGALNVTASGIISTTGERSRGLVAQSIGGTGGDGGSSRGIVGIGGTGGGGGSGSSIFANSTADITTTGDDAIGVLLQSIGGGGGAAGSTAGLAAIGGNGGSGSTGGLLSTTIGGAIGTSGNGADGVVVQSIGGSGGHGSNTLAVSVDFSLAIAGSGGSGGDGGEIQQLKTQSGSSITTHGDNARGIAAMSVGGGGGHGGNALSVAAGLDAPGIAVAVGGSGGAGGSAGDVNFNLYGSVSTDGDNATAISALSVGGGGGSAGTTVAAAAGSDMGAFSLAVGGAGGGAGDGGEITVCRGVSDEQADGTCASEGANGEGIVQTSGDGAMGLYASSIGGSGGQSGATISGTVSNSESVGLAIGGNGGQGGNGAAVTVYSSGGITTTGAASSALVASSIAGSGGNAHVVGSIGAVGDEGVNIGIGGDGGAAGVSDAVYILSTDTISTTGKMSAGIQATSRAGGGGSGSGVFSGEVVSSGSADVAVGGAGGSGGNAGDVTVGWTGTTLDTSDDHSPGILAMSGAGSGGNAGLAFSGDGVSLASSSVTLGGQGGSGGDAGITTVTASGQIETAGFMSEGIVAISQGGNGGRGGLSLTGAGVNQGTAAVTLGGDGGTGGTANQVWVRTLEGSSITTDGPSAAGISALSLGGNGGHGGAAIEAGMNVDFTGDEIPAGAATLTLGGDGGTAGASDYTYVHNNAVISTQDFNSAGIQAQSIAGSGGAGGMAISGTMNVASSETIDNSLVIGGDGGSGGQAGETRVENVADITTTGDASNGILAQSIGGAGGAGGLTYNILSNFASGGSLAITNEVTIGGGGGSGGTGGRASVNNLGPITTYGTSSSGIYVQSIGGNGGTGGFGGTGIFNVGLPSSGSQEDSAQGGSTKVGLNITVGGEGGGGAIGGNVQVENQGGGHINTGGSGAYGIFAQSVGGHGGDGGLSSSFSQKLTIPALVSVEDDSNGDSSNTSRTFNLKMGGDGGSGAHAGTVSVNNSAGITTTGDVAHGIVSQSVGGGGGVGGSTSGNFDSFESRDISSRTGETIKRLRSKYNITTLQGSIGTGTLSIGGTGGAAGNGSTSTVTNTGAVSTTGTNAYGIFAQSIGGGGGSGGSAASITATYSLQLGGDGGGGGDGGVVTITTSNTTTTTGYGSTAVFAQSIGAGGGNTGSKTGFSAIEDVTLAIGGQGGVSGNGGAVNVTYNSGTITTGAEQSSGIFAQSVGGGGGTHFGGIGTFSEDVTVHENLVGGVENSSGNGGDVTIVSAANITTGPAEPGSLNAASIGIFAQSVGGGGGYSGSMILKNYEKIGANVRSSSSSASGNGGAVTVNQSGTITTTGDNSVGIFAQSVGGAGGVMGTLDKSSDDSSYVGSFGGEGVAGAVAVYAGGDIQTSGAGAHGIFAQYAGGTDSAGPVADETVIVQPSADVIATGAGAHAIHIENMGSGVGDVHIEIGGGSTVNGGDKTTDANAQDGAGVYINSSQDSQLNNSGTIKAVSGVAIKNLGGGTLTLTNNGTVDGNIFGPCQPNCSQDEVAQSSSLASSSANSLASSSIYVDNLSDGVLNAGETLEVAQLRNWGQINVGQADTVSGTQITGDFEQHTGQIVFDVDMSSIEIDTLTVDGQAELEGTLDVNVLEVSEYQNGTQSLKIIEAAGGLDVSELEVIPSVVARYALETASATELNLSYGVDYVNDALVRELNTNQRGLTSYFDSLYHAGELDEDLAKTLIGVTTTEDYARLLNLMGPELALANGVAGLSQTLSFADTLFSCPNEDQGSIWFDNGQCGYLTFSANRLDRDGTGGASGFSQDGTRINAGGQMLLDNGFAIGASLAYDSTSLTTDAGASSNGSTFSGGLSAKGFADRWEFGAAVHASNTSYDNSWSYQGSTASGQQDQWRAGAELRAGYLFEQGGWMFKPRLGLGMTHFGGSSYTETGTATAFAVDTSSETFAYVRPALEVTGSFLTPGGTEIRPNAVFSVTQFFGDTSFDATARLAGSPASVTPFDWQTEIDTTQFDVSAGITVLSESGASFDISAFGHMTENQTGVGGKMRLSIPF